VLAATRPHVTAASSPAEIADLVLGEILGWDICAQPATGLAVDRLPECRAAIHPLLRDGLSRAEAGSPTALAPSPGLDRALGRLVELVTSHFGAAIAAPPAARDELHVTVVGEVLDRVSGDAELTRRAGEVRRAAGLAEAAMERHYGCLTLRALERATTDRTHAHPPAGAEPAGDGGEGVGAAGSSWLPWYATPQVTWTEQRACRLARLRSALGCFPYQRNYEQLTAAELTALQSANATLTSVAFCGAGSLPLSGILLNVLTDAAVTLVDVDVEAAGMAGRLVDHLAALGVLERGAVEVVLADAATADLSRCDVVVVASLVDEDATLQVAQRLARSGRWSRRPLLMTRSAAGLVGLFAYEPVPVGAITAAGHRHLGAVVPLTGVTVSATARDRRVAVPITSPDLLAIADQDVLNRSELFRPL
jgi:hypothetical protein